MLEPIITMLSNLAKPMGPYMARISFIKEQLTTLPKVLSIPNEQIFSTMGITYCLERCFYPFIKKVS